MARRTLDELASLLPNEEGARSARLADLSDYQWVHDIRMALVDEAAKRQHIGNIVSQQFKDPDTGSSYIMLFSSDNSNNFIQVYRETEYQREFHEAGEGRQLQLGRSSKAGDGWKLHVSVGNPGDQVGAARNVAAAWGLAMGLVD